MTPRARAGAALVLATAVLTAFWGLDVRDLSSTELEEFSGSGPRGILLRSITPTDNDWGAHMPLSHVIRWWLVELLGETRAWVWRLHVALASVAAAGVTVFGTRRQLGPWSILAGLLVALHPVTSFHAHESTNYGFGALLGALLLVALLAWEEGARRGALLLAGALLLGLSSDLFFVFPAAVAFAWTGWRALREPERRRPFAVAWGAAAAVLALPGAWFAVHMARLGGEGLVSPHADPIPEESLGLVATTWDLASRFAGGYLGGYGDAGEADLWVVGGPLLLLLACGLALLRPPGRPSLPRTAAALLLGSFGLVLVARLVFGVITGREFTTEPRIYTALVAPLAVALTALVRALAERSRALGGLAAAGLVVALAVPTARQLATLSDRDSRAVALLASHARPDDALVVSRQVRWRLPPQLADQVVDCVSGAERIWWAREGDGGEVPSPPLCDAAPPGPRHVTLHHRYVPPPYDRKSASYLPELVVTAFAPGPAPDGPAPPTVSVRRGFLSGGGALQVEARVQPQADGRPDDGVEPRTRRQDLQGPLHVFEPEPTPAWVRFGVRPAVEDGPSLAGLLRPLRVPLQDLDATPVLASPLAPPPMELPALSAPGLRVFERLLRTLLGVGLLLSSLLSLRPGRTEP